MANLSQVAFKLLTDVLSISHFLGTMMLGSASNSKEIVILVLHRM